MVQLISFIIFIISAGIVSFILYFKVPLIANLPKDGNHGFKKPKVVAHVERKIKDTHFHVFQKQVFTQKFLSKTKVLIMKAEAKVDELLNLIRKNARDLENKNGKK